MPKNPEFRRSNPRDENPESWRFAKKSGWSENCENPEFWDLRPKIKNPDPESPIKSHSEANSDY